MAPLRCSSERLRPRRTSRDGPRRATVTEERYGDNDMNTTQTSQVIHWVHRCPRASENHILVKKSITPSTLDKNEKQNFLRFQTQTDSINIRQLIANTELTKCHDFKRALKNRIKSTTNRSESERIDMKSKRINAKSMPMFNHKHQEPLGGAQCFLDITKRHATESNDSKTTPQHACRKPVFLWYLPSSPLSSQVKCDMRSESPTNMAICLAQTGLCNDAKCSV